MYKVTTYLNEDNMPYIVKEDVKYDVDFSEKWKDSEKMYELCQRIKMTERATEMVLMLVFDSAGHAICASEVSTGSINYSVLSPREMAQTMLLTGGVACILAHNHPSGEYQPSDDDIAITLKIKEALKLLNLSLWDHLVVGRQGYYSMAKEGVIN